MKAVKISLAVTCVLACMVAAVVALVDNPAKHPAARRVVYVDRHKLVVLHPAWQQVMALEQAMQDLSRDKAVVTSRAGDLDSINIVGPEPTQISPTHSELMRLLEKRALSELVYVENRERSKIDHELAKKRLELEADLRVEIAEKTRETNEIIASQRHRIDAERATDRLDTQLKIAAARSRLSTLNSSEEKKSRDDLQIAMERLTAFDNETAGQIDQHIQPPKDELDVFTARRRTQVDAEIEGLRSERESQMMTGIKAQRDATVRTLQEDAINASLPANYESSLPFSEGKLSPLRTAVGAKTLNMADQSSEGQAIRVMRECRNRLMARILDDVTRMAQSKAQERGLTVKFDKRPTGQPDFSLEMAKLMMSRRPQRMVAAARGAE